MYYERQLKKNWMHTMRKKKTARGTRPGKPDREIQTKILKQMHKLEFKYYHNTESGACSRNALWESRIQVAAGVATPRVHEMPSNKAAQVTTSCALPQPRTNPTNSIPKV